MRLFVAIYPDEPTRAWIADAQKRLRRELAHFQRDIRWVEPESVHVTLAFLGNVSEAAPIAQALETCLCERMELGVAGLGVFPNSRRPSVLHAHVSDATGMLARLQTEITTALTPFVEPERRRFIPHLTLARIRPQAHPKLTKALKSLLGNDPSPQQSWIVNEFALMRSQIDSAGATHTTLRVFA